jgi:hypothetical protein
VLYVPGAPGTALALAPMLVTPADGVDAPAKLPIVVELAPSANAAKPTEVAPPEVPLAAPWATDEMPQVTSCWFAEADPEPLIGNEPVALPAADLAAVASERDKTYGLRYRLTDMLTERKRIDINDAQTIDAKANVLTDDFAPVETLRGIERHNRKLP